MQIRSRNQGSTETKLNNEVLSNTIHGLVPNRSERKRNGRVNLRGAEGQEERWEEHEERRVKKKREAGVRKPRRRGILRETRKPLRRDRRCSLCAVSLAVADRRKQGRRTMGGKEMKRTSSARKSVLHWRSQSNRVIETGHGAVSGPFLSCLFFLPALPAVAKFAFPARFRTIGVTRENVNFSSGQARRKKVL